MEHGRQTLIFITLTVALAGCQSPPAPTVTIVGLWPEHPPIRYKPFDLWTGGNCYIWPQLESRQPTLRWEAFPRPADLAADTNAVLGEITETAYDLRIWRNIDGFPAELVYARDALPAPVHAVEQALPHRGWYFWSVRARFEICGGVRVTEWSRIDSPPPLCPTQRGASNFPDARYYQFFAP